MLKHFVFLISIFFSASALSQNVDDFQLLQRVGVKVMEKYKFELPSKPRLISVYRPEQTPVAATTTAFGKCFVILNTNTKSWSKWEAFLEGENLSMEEVFEFALLHEVGHCVNKASSKPFKPGYDSEAFADSYAFSQLKQTLTPSEFLRQLDAIIQARKSMGFIALFTGHNTADKLEKVRNEYLAELHNEDKPVY